MLPIWLLAELTVMIYDWRFWEPWAGSMLAVLLPKLRFWIGNHDWHNCFLDVFVTLCGVNPYWTQKSFKINNFLYYKRLNKEKTPGRCIQSGYLLI